MSDEEPLILSMAIGAHTERSSREASAVRSNQLAPGDIGTTYVLAGYARVSTQDDGKIAVEAQLRAFRAALQFAHEYFLSTGDQLSLSLGFDHRGSFRKQFVAKDASNRQRRNPTLRDLHPQIVQTFGRIAEEFGIDISTIAVLPQDSARTRITQALLGSGRSVRELRGLIAFPADHTDIGKACEHVDETEGDSLAPKATCAALVLEDYKLAVKGRTASEDQSRLEVFLEECTWNPTDLFVKAIQYGTKIGMDLAVRLHLVSKSGKVSSGRWSAIR